MKDEGNYNKARRSRDESSSSNERRGEEEKIPEPMVRRDDGKNSLIVLLKAQTWDRESHGLYDYESRRVQKLELKVEKEGYMIRGKENVTFQNDTSIVKTQDDTVLFQLIKKNDKYYVRPINENQPSDRLWLVIRSLKDGYVIKRHDILKLGRMKFKVKEYRTETEFFEGDHIEKGPHKGFDELHMVESSDSGDIM
jgi:hypothetical protein